MASPRKRSRAKTCVHSYSKLIHAYFASPQYAALSARAVKALIDLLAQYRGSNNGDLSAAWSIMNKRGWTSKDQLVKALRELLESGWIIVTRPGGRRITTLYAITFFSIDDCNGKHDVKSMSAPLHSWKRELCQRH